MDLGAWGDAVASFALALDDGVDQAFPPERRVELTYVPRRRAPPTTISRAANASVSRPWHWPVISAISRRGARRFPSRAMPACGGRRWRPRSGRGARAVHRGRANVCPAFAARVLGLMAEVAFAAFDFDRGLEFARLRHGTRRNRWRRRCRGLRIVRGAIATSGATGARRIRSVLRGERRARRCHRLLRQRMGASTAAVGVLVARWLTEARSGPGEAEHHASAGWIGPSCR